MRIRTTLGQLGAGIAAEFRSLFGFQEPAGGTTPDWPESMKDRPYLQNFALSKEGWDRARAVRIVGIVRACVLRKAQDAASLPVMIEQQSGKDWKPIERQPRNVADVWHNGNDEQCGLEVVRDFGAMYWTHGNAYLNAQTFGTRTVRQLRVLPSHLTKVIPVDGRRVGAYVFNRDGIEEAIKPQFVVHWKDFTPDDEPVGTSPLESVTFQYETRHDLMRLYQKVVRNGGVGAGFFRVSQDSNGNRLPLPLADRERMRIDLRRMRRALDMDVILDQLEFERLGLTFQELDFLSNCKLADSDICLALGVPPWMVGIKEGGKLGAQNTASETDERIYWRNLKSELDIRDAVLTEKLAPLFGEGIRFRTDWSAVTPLIQPLITHAEKILALTGRPSVLTLNQALAMYGLPRSEAEDADDLHDAPVPIVATPGAPAAGETQPAAVGGEGEDERKGRRMIESEERKKAWEGKDRLITRYEQKARTLFVEILRGERRRVMDALEDSGLRAYTAKRLINLDDVAVPNPDDEEAVREFFEALLAERGAEAAAEIALALELKMDAQAVRDFIARRVTLAVDGTAITRLQKVRLVLAPMVERNATLSEMADAVAGLYDGFESGIGTVVRTETVSAFNFATAEAWRQSGEVESMEWLSARDEAVRATHAEADGQIAQLGDAFRVGNDLLEYPGDPNGSPEEICNCRCTVLPVLTERAKRVRFKRYLDGVLHGIEARR